MSCPKCGFALRESKFKKNEYYCSNYKSGCKHKQIGIDGRPVPAARPMLTQILPLETPTSEQRIIFDCMKTSNEHTFISALAGTGKTTAIVQLVRIFTERNLSVACLAFAKRDRLALEHRCAGRAFVKTSNGAGYSIMTDYAKRSGSKIRVVDGLAWTILQNRENDNEEKIPGMVKNNAITLIDKARSIIPLSAKGDLPTRPTHDDYNELSMRFGIEHDPKHIQQTYEIADWLFDQFSNLQFAFNVGIDFTGQMFLPVYHNIQPATKYNRVMVDEAQDQSWINRQIALKFVKPDGKIVVVGDENQAIYAWRGADGDSLGEWRKLLDDAESFPLTVCQRCSDAVINDAQKIVPSIQGTGKHTGTSRTITESQFLSELVTKRKGLVLCRANAPGVSLCLELMRNGIAAVVLKNDITRTLEAYINKITAWDDKVSISDVISKMETYLAEQIEKMKAWRNGEAKIQQLQDKNDTIVAFASCDDVKTAGDVKRKIRQLFVDVGEDDSLGEKASKIIVIGTVHGAKGGEAPTVYLYSPESKKRSLWDSIWLDDTDRDNVLYVAITRAEKEIVYAGVPPTLARFSQPKDSERYDD